ncbi:MAG: winged helix-turn-helix domain-containing protein [Thaumarchaeota archaeon]|nr:winged helix-turn-helix domain-containing protein [Nitrososphaerota archaeon]
MTDVPNAIATLGPSETKTVSASVESVGALLDVLTDGYSRKIVSSTVLEGRTVDEICSAQQIPVSTCYRKVRRLVDQGLLVAERSATTRGKRNVAYRSAFSCVRVEMKDGQVFVHLTVNPGVAKSGNYVA